MRIEEAPCEGAHSPIQTSYPLYHVKDGLIEHSSHSAITSSTLSIESPQAQSLYITPVPERPKKAKDLRLACLGHIQKLKGIPSTAKAILTWLVTIRQWRADRLIIVGKGECAERFGISRRHVIRLFQILEESGCLRIAKRGGSTRGSKREANTYALGLLFDTLPPQESKRRPVTRMSLVPQVPLVTEMSNDQCQECHPLPILTPYKNTHIKELPSAFTKENWINRGQAAYPDWDTDNMMGAFYDGEMKGLNGNWPSFQDKCYWLRRTSAKTTSVVVPQVWQKQPSKHQEPSSFNPPVKPHDYSQPITLEDQIYTELKEGTSKWALYHIKAEIDPAVYASALAKAETRIEMSKTVVQAFRDVMASTTTHLKPPKEAWIKECVRIGIGESKASDSYEQLNRTGWLMGNGSVINNWKQYVNGIGKAEARRKAKTF